MNGIIEALKARGFYIGKTKGTSMEPMLREGRDRVVIVPPEFPLKKYDVPLYTRDGHYTLHRIIKVKKNGQYVICGDNRVDYEYDITNDRIIGVLIAFYQGDKYIECTDEAYLRYVRRMRRRFPLRWMSAMFWRAYRKIRRTARSKK